MLITLPSTLWTSQPGETPSDPATDLAGLRRLSYRTLAFVIVVLGGAAIFVPIGGAVIGSGNVGVESRVKRIAHPFGGVVEQIFVRNGQQVKKGDIMLRFNNRVSGSAAEYASLSVDEQSAQRARLEAEQFDRTAILFPADLAKRTDRPAVTAMARERELFDVRRRAFHAQIGQLHERIGQIREEVAGYRAQIVSLQQQQALIAPELAGVQSLYEKQLVTIGRKNALERTAVELGRNIGSLQSAIAQAAGRVGEANEQIITLTQSRRSDAGTQLTQLSTALNQQRAQHASAMDQEDRTTMRSPSDGIVERLAVNSRGDVVRPADTVMEIVPMKDELIIEGVVSPGDVDQLHQGQKARIRFSAFNSTATPEVAGTLSVLSSERMPDADGQPSYYSIRVSIDPASLEKIGGTKVLRPGMPAEIFIETGQRSMISYITKPLRDQFARAFRDN